MFIAYSLANILLKTRQGTPKLNLLKFYFSDISYKFHDNQLMKRRERENYLQQNSDSITVALQHSHKQCRGTSPRSCSTKVQKKKKNQSVSWSLYMLTNLINEQCFSNYFLQQVLLTLTMYSSNCYKIQLLYAPCMLVLLSLQLMWWWSVGKRCDLTEYPHQPQLAALLIKLHFIHHWLLSYILAPNSLIQIHKLLSTSGL